jgi:hypothetical protein
MSTPPSPGSDQTQVVYVREPAHWGRRILVLIGVVALGTAAFFGFAAVNLLPSFISNPFKKQVDDRTGPVVLQSVQSLSNYVAARGNFQVVVDYKEDRAWIPDFISSYHALFVAYGSVEAYVDFSGLAQDAIQVSADGKEVVVTLPEPQLTEVRLDVNKSHVYSLDEGILENLQGLISNDLDRQGKLYQLAVQKIEEAARQSEILSRARENTEKELTAILTTLGFTRVTIQWKTNPQ